MAEKSNPGVQALIIGTVLGLAAAGYGGYTMSSCTITEPVLSVKSNKKDSSLTAEATAISDNQKRNRDIIDCAPEGATINGKPRMAPLFFSTELWQISLAAEKKNTVVDIYDPSAANIHGKIPNTWFITNGIADALGKSTGAEMDSDGDGFSNSEEFSAKTHPGNAASYPDLVSQNTTPKMVVTRISKASAIITIDTMFGMAAKTPDAANIRIYAKETDMMPIHRATVKPGESFDLEPGKEKTNRFTIVAFEKKEFTGSGNRLSTENVIRIRDNETANELEKEFIVRAGKPNPYKKDEKPDEKKGRKINDTTITLSVTAGSALGKPEGTTKVQLHDKFTIPGGNCEGKTISATLVSVDDNKNVNIQVDGQESPVNVPYHSKK